MQENNTQNNRNDINNVNTQGIRFYNSDGQTFQSTIQLGYWKETLQIRINPALPEAQRTAKSKFDYNAQSSVTLAVEDVALLTEILKEANTTPGEFNKGITIGGNNLLSIERIDGQDAPCIVIYTGIAEGTMKCDNVLGYDFNTQSTTISGYRPDGSADIEVKQHSGQFMAFMSIVEAFIPSIGGSATHSVRYHDRFFRSKIAGGSSASSASYTAKPSNNVWGGAGNGGAQQESADLNGFI